MAVSKFVPFHKLMHNSDKSKLTMSKLMNVKYNYDHFFAAFRKYVWPLESTTYKRYGPSPVGDSFVVSPGATVIGKYMFLFKVKYVITIPHFSPGHGGQVGFRHLLSGVIHCKDMDWACGFKSHWAWLVGILLLSH